MARIKIEDLPVLEELSKKETKGIFGGAVFDGSVEVSTIDSTSDELSVFESYSLTGKRQIG